MTNEKRMISCCGDCINYSLSKHKCLLCKNKERDPRSPFYDDCPLPKGVEVVRCKDCKHWNNGDCYRLELSRPDDFCSYGERRCE